MVKYARVCALGLALLYGPLELRAQSFACRRAQETVEAVRREFASGKADHKQILERLRIAMDLCPSSGDVYRLAACSAEALKDPRAESWRTRAVLNRASSSGCSELAGASETAQPLPGFVRQKYALVVGIGNFRDPRIPRLQYTAKDARDIAQVLTDPNYGRFDPANVTVLTNETATRATILKGLQDLYVRSAPDDLVLIYISSHGSPSDRRLGLAGVGYIVTYDTSLDNVFVDALDYKQFSENVSLLRARRKVMLLDTCFSGQGLPGQKALITEGLGVGEATAKLFLSGEGDYFIASSRDDEKSWESDKLQNSYFTHYLIQALKASKEPPTIRQVFDQLTAGVAETVLREKQAPQHPSIYPLSGAGEVRIGVMPTGASSPNSALVK
jgi:hypothetical protein